MSSGVTVDEIQKLTREVEDAFRGQTNQETLAGINQAMDTFAGVENELSGWVAVATAGIIEFDQQDLTELDEMLETVERSRTSVAPERMTAQTINAVQTLSNAARVLSERLAKAVTRPIERRQQRLHETLEIAARFSEDDLPAHASAMTDLDSVMGELPSGDRQTLAKVIHEADEALARADRLWANLPGELQDFYRSLTREGRVRLSEIAEGTLLSLLNSPLAPSLDIGLGGAREDVT